MKHRPQPAAIADLEFYRRLAEARFCEGIVAAILELSGYEVYPYGYETLLPPLRRRFRQNHARPSPTEARLRSTPDLLVVDPAARARPSSPRLVEVKFRRWTSPHDVRLSGVEGYQTYWPDALLVVVIPAGDTFYAQAVERLNGRKRSFDLPRQFQRLHAFFPRVKPATLTALAQEVKRFAAVP
jgi:hypothetical protein